MICPGSLPRWKQVLQISLKTSPLQTQECDSGYTPTYNSLDLILNNISSQSGVGQFVFWFIFANALRSRFRHSVGQYAEDNVNSGQLPLSAVDFLVYV